MRGGESGRLWEAQSIVFFTLRAGPPTHFILSVLFSEKVIARASLTSAHSRLRRSWPYLIPNRSFCAPFGALRLSARPIGGGGSYPETMTLFRIQNLISNWVFYPEAMILFRRPCCMMMSTMPSASVIGVSRFPPPAALKWE